MDWLLVCLAAVLVTLATYYWIFLQRFRRQWKNVPYITPIPVFGSLKLLEGVNWNLHDLERHYYNKYGRLYAFLQGRFPVLTVGDPELIKLITVKDATTVFLNRKVMLDDKLSKAMLFTTKDEQWKKIRNAVTPTFSSGKMKWMILIINECAQDLIDNLREQIRNEDFNVKETIGAFTIDVNSSVAFATRINSFKQPNHPFVVNSKKVFHNEYVRFATLLMYSFPEILSVLRNSKLINFFDMSFFEEQTKKVLEERRRENRNESTRRVDFLQLMIDAQKNFEKTQTRIYIRRASEEGLKMSDEFEIVNKLTELEMFAQCVTFFTVGFDTTAATITAALHLLARHPECQEKLYLEVQKTLKSSNGEVTYDMLKSMPYLEAVVSETLRMYPALAFITREVGEDYRLGDTGIQLKKGMEVNIPVTALHYDPEFFPEPFKFDPDRFLPENKDSFNQFTYMPFGMGPRNCVAIRFSQMEVKVALIHLLREFQFSRSPRTTDKIDVVKGTLLFLPINVFLKVEERTAKTAEI